MRAKGLGNMTATRDEIYKAIEAERNYQDEKWGFNPHEVGAWILIMESELAEAKEAWVKHPGNEEALREVLQVISVGVACIEQHCVVERVAQHAEGGGGSEG